MFKKFCPTCNNEIEYSSKWALDDSIRKNRNCRKCSKKGTIPSFIINGKINDDVLKKISNNWFKSGERPKNADLRKNKTYEEIYGSDKAKEIKTKLSIYKKTEESNIKRSETCKKADCGKNNIGRIPTTETKLKISKKMKNRVFSDEHKKNMRISALKFKNKKLLATGGKMVPNFNFDACDLFDKMSLEKNIHIQHALNGGEFHIPELGYWVDGYDQKNNVVYEYDEKKHFSLDGKLKEKCVKRQNEIVNFLNCGFIRIKDV